MAREFGFLINFGLIRLRYFRFYTRNSSSGHPNNFLNILTSYKLYRETERSIFVNHNYQNSFIRSAV